MSWRAYLGAGVALLLPLPLVLVTLGVLRSTPPETIDGRAISPLLATHERALLRTYHRDCSKSSECEAGLGCLHDTRAHAKYCADSQCLTDAQCLDGQVCRLLATEGQGPLVRYCVPLGIRAEGERCVEIASSREGACREGLLCGGAAGFCGRPCQLNAPASCPLNFFCVPDIPSPLCLPSCEQTRCPEGMHCIRHEEGASACARVYGPTCQQTPCPNGQRCEVIHAAARPGIIWSECEERCGDGQPPCPHGRVCDGWSCKQPCDPNGPNTCDEGYRCFQRRPSGPWFCHPTW